jgi:hypothetical protein
VLREGFRDFRCAKTLSPGAFAAQAAPLLRKPHL